MEYYSLFFLGHPHGIMICKDKACLVFTYHPPRSRYPLYSVVPPSCSLLSLMQKQPAFGCSTVSNALERPLAIGTTASSQQHNSLYLRTLAAQPEARSQKPGAVVPAVQLVTSNDQPATWLFNSSFNIYNS